MPASSSVRKKKPAPSTVSPPAPFPARSGRPGRPRKNEAAAGTAEALGPSRIRHAALALIDAKGLAAFNIRDLATQLGVFPAAVYWHVPSRDALLSGVIALALQGVGASAPAGPWQARLRALLQDFREALRRHPQLAPLVANQLAYNAAFDAPLLEQVVGALEDARFEGEALVDAFNVVIAAMCGFATLELSTAPSGPSAEWEAACRAQIDAVDREQLPHLGRHIDALRNRAFLLRWSGGNECPLDSGFEAWIDVLLRGLEARSRALRRT